MTDEIPTNPNDLVWPTDTVGFLQPLKREILKAVDRTRGHPDKITTLFDTLVMAAKFARVRAPILQEAYQPIMQVVPYGEPDAEEPVVSVKEKTDGDGKKAAE